jgi:Flp pilus assembly protein TadG
MERHSFSAEHKEQGSIIVMTALVMVAVIGFMALGVDLGILLLQKRLLANAVDAAALAGVQELPANPSSAQNIAYQYGVLNRINADELSVAVSTLDNEVAVSAQRSVRLFFAPVLGFDVAVVSAQARARTGPVGGVRGTVPLSVVEQEFVYGAKYMLKYGSQPLDDIPGGHYGGNFGALALGGKGGNTYRDNLANGYSGILRVGDMVDTEPGNMVGPTGVGVKARLSHPDAAKCEFATAGPHCPQYLIVPIIDGFSSGGSHSVRILGFAVFFLEDYHNSGAYRGSVVGRFLRRSVDGEIGPGRDYGLHAYKLVQ